MHRADPPGPCCFRPRPPVGPIAPSIPSRSLSLRPPPLGLSPEHLLTAHPLSLILFWYITPPTRKPTHQTTTTPALTSTYPLCTRPVSHPPPALAALPRGKTPRPAVARLTPPAAPAGENPHTLASIIYPRVNHHHTRPPSFPATRPARPSIHQHPAPRARLFIRRRPIWASPPRNPAPARAPAHCVVSDLLLPSLRSPPELTRASAGAWPVLSRHPAHPRPPCSARASKGAYHPAPHHPCLHHLPPG